jgi:hypothetical protein
MTVELTVSPGATVSGRVIRPGGQPLAFAQVDLQRPPGHRLAAEDQGLADQPIATTADAQGQFRLEGVPPGEWVVSAAFDGLRRSRFVLITTATGQTAAYLELRAEPLVAGLSGRVVGPDGKTPSEFARVDLAEDSATTEVLTAVTDRQGTFRFEWLSPGDYHATVYTADPALGSIHCPGLRLIGTTETEFRLPRAGTITGRVVGVDPQATSATVRTCPGLRPPADFRLTPTSADVKPDGTYRLEHLSPGEYTVYFLAKGTDQAPTGSVRVSLKEGEEVKAPDLVVGR